MFEEMRLGSEFFEELVAIDRRIAQTVAEAGCRFCGGRLHRGDYLRKPRGGLLAEAAEAFRWRFSLCCGRDGCRRRATPPSVRFLGRRVYVGAAVILGSVVALVLSAGGASRRTGIPARTTRRWLRWWRGPFTTTPVFVEIAARMVAIDRWRMPASILDSIPVPPLTAIQKLLGWLAPLSTSSTAEGSSFVRVIM